MREMTVHTDRIQFYVRKAQWQRRRLCTLYILCYPRFHFLFLDVEIETLCRGLEHRDKNMLLIPSILFKQ
jgi:hypothetical protein